jgi:hypothetical protein
MQDLPNALLAAQDTGQMFSMRTLPENVSHATPESFLLSPGLRRQPLVIHALLEPHLAFLLPTHPPPAKRALAAFFRVRVRPRLAASA